MTDRLSSYGYAFQIKVITALLTDKSFLQQISDIMVPKYFESEANNWIVDIILEYHKEYKSSPTLEVMKVKMEDLDHDVLKTQVVEHLKDAWRYTDAPDLEFIKEQALDFCKNQEIKKAILSSVELLKHGKYEEIKAAVDDALKSGGDKDIGHEYMTNIEERYNEAVRHVQETPWEVINELTDGGLGKGELGVVVAPTGAGKSMVLVHLGASALKQGKNVLHYTLELSDTIVASRYDSAITGVELKNLSVFKEKIYDEIKDLTGKLIVKEYPTRSASIQRLKNHIDKLRRRDFVPDMIIVDYGDLIKPESSKRDEKRHQLETIYEELRGLAQEVGCPLWTASQTNRSGLNAEVITMESISEAFNKCFVADFIFTVSRTIEDKNSNQGRIFVAKNRNGPDGLIYPIFMDTSNVNIKVLPPSEETVGEVMEKSSKERLDNLKQKYANFKKEQRR